MGLLLLGAVWATGCTEQAEDIDRVQPHYLTKTDLDGAWYFRQTVVDMPPTTGYYVGAFTGIEGGVEKIRWEIREDQLIARRIHPVVPGLEDEETLDGAEYDGEPVAVYAITSHFDIIRKFDTSTGEQSNVLVENQTLRPWYERDHIRVDWSSNQLPGPVDLGGFFAIDPDSVSTNSDWVRETESDDPDHAQVDPDFIFLTTEYLNDDGGFTCYLNYGMATAGSNDACGMTEVEVRSAFVKIDPEEAAQFEPRPYLDRARMYDEDGDPLRYVTVSVGTDAVTQIDVACTPEVLERLAPEVSAEDCRDLQWDQAGRFGFFRTMRHGYDRRVGGGHDLTREYYANHHQIWKATRTETGATIPKAERALRPVVYHLNPNFPDDLKAVAVRIGHNWNTAFMGAATAATGKSAAEIGDQLAADFDHQGVFIEGDALAERALFQIRENTCSERGITAYLNRPGNEPMRAVAADATGGEGLLPGNLETVCSALTWHSKRADGVERFVWQQMGDPRFSFVWWVHDDQPYGPLGYGPSSADAETGQLISGNAYVYGAAIDRYARDAADMVRFVNGDAELLDIRDGHQLREWLLAGGTTPAGDAAAITPEFQQAISQRIGTPFMSGYRGFMGPDGMDEAAMMRHMRDRMRHTSPDDPMALAFDAPLDPGRSRLAALADDPDFRARMLSPEMLRLVGPMFGWQPGETPPAEMEALALELLLDPAALQRRADERRQKFAERNVFLAEGMDDSIIGQALELAGLPPEEVYRVLREEIFEAVMLHEIGHTVGLTHNFEASMDALNYQDDFWHIREQYDESEWDRQRLPEYRYASIMDYGSRFNSDTKGLGKYDLAAIKFVYGGHVETFADEVPVPGRLDLKLALGDYTAIPELLGGDVGNLWNRVDRPIDEMADARKNGVRRNGVLFAEDPARPASDYWIDAAVPYHYCADFLRGDLNCRTWDEGANHTEAVEAAIQRYWNYYAFNSYRRKRNENSFINGFFGRQDRLREYLSYPWKYYYFYDAYPVALRDDLLRASVLGLNFINQVLGTPEPGQYCQYSAGLYLPAWYFNRSTQLQCNIVEVPIGEARDPYLGFSDEHVYRIDYIGVFYDKVNLLIELFDNRTRFFRLVDDTDDRQYSIGYYRAFQDELIKLTRDLVFGAVINFTLADGDYVFLEDTVFNRLVTDDGFAAQPLVDPARVAAGEPLAARPEPKLFTQIPFNVATQALTAGTILNTSTWDQQLDLVEYLTVVEVGSGDDRVFGPDVDVVTFTHPMTGQQYRAAQTADGRSIAYELLAFASAYVESDWDPARRAHEADPDIPEYREDYDIKNRQLQDIFEMIDFLRQLRSWADWGQ